MISTQLEYFNNIVQSIEPSAKVFLKNQSNLMKFIGWCMKPINKDFMTSYATTICNRIYIPTNWQYKNIRSLLYHEVRHVTQCKWCGFGIHPWIGFIPYAILYLFFPLPIIGAWCRYRFELDAEAFVWKKKFKEQGELIKEILFRVETFTNILSSWIYLKPLPSKWIKWGFKRKFKKIIDSYNNY